MLNTIPTMLGNEKNDELRVKVFEEVKKAMFFMKAFKALGPDGFPPTFFRHLWEVIKNELVWATRDMIKTRKMLTRINKTFIVLVPKIQRSRNIRDFRLTNLCNTIYKVFSKVLVNKIKPFLDMVIRSPQKGFISFIKF